MAAPIAVWHAERVNFTRLLDLLHRQAVIPHAEIEVAATIYLVYYGNHIVKEELFQISSGTILIAPHGHSETHTPQPLQ